MSINRGDKVKHIEGKAPIESAANSEYVVLEYFVNEAKQKTVHVQDLETGRKYYRDPETLEKI